MDQTSTEINEVDDEGGPAVIFDPPKGKKILVVEDEAAIRETITEYLRRLGYDVSSAIDGVEGTTSVNEQEFDLIITDLSMPRKDGFGFMKEAIQVQPLTPIIILSGQGTFENAIRAIHLGAYDFVAKPIVDFDAFKITINRGLERKSLVLVQKNYQRNLEKVIAEQTQELIEKNVMLQDYADQLEDVSVSVISSLTVALEEKDRYTAGHSNRVTQYSEGIGRQLGLSEPDLWLLSTAAKLHDLGKLMIDISFINKPGPLSPNEWDMMKQHPVIAERILVPLPFLDDVRPLIRSHHERLDGSGYPDGLKGDEIDQMTQILAVADSLDAMTSKRSYRPTLIKKEALAELKSCKGRLYSPEIVDALIVFLTKTPNLI